MAVPKQHRSKSRQGQARMHKYIRASKFVACTKCGHEILSHTACDNCGTYKGVVVKDVMAKLNKKEKKKKEREMEEQGGA